jgi:decaprenylphospho-beta-D-ribofuranose 2-oxidase
MAGSRGDSSLRSKSEKELKQLTGWGHFPKVEGYEESSEFLPAITSHAVLSRGLARSYGDASLPPAGGHIVANSTRADRILAFDEKLGVLRAESGLSLFEINRFFLKREWTVPVAPGTQFITLGGMVAADVHGKNDGSFGEHIENILLQLADGKIISCSPTHESDLFRTTVGGMGLTGHILEVSFRMQKIHSPWIYTESERFTNLEEMVDALTNAAQDWPYTVAWLDCLTSKDQMGRGILQKGRWAEKHEAPLHFEPLNAGFSVPCLLPDWFLNRFFVKTFNALNYWKHFDAKKTGIVHPQTFFYPLDRVQHWNRLYGKAGFTQYQCLIPEAAGRAAIREIFSVLHEQNPPVYLCVMKHCGKNGTGMISFLKPGITIALDIPMRENHTQSVIDRLNEFVITKGGCVYLAKDALTKAEHFQSMEPRLNEWKQLRKKWDPQQRLKSALSLRLFGG